VPASAEEILPGSRAVYCAPWLALTFPLMTNEVPAARLRSLPDGAGQGLAAEGDQRGGQRRGHRDREGCRDDHQSVSIHPRQYQRTP